MIHKQWANAAELLYKSQARLRCATRRFHCALDSFQQLTILSFCARATNWEHLPVINIRGCQSTTRLSKSISASLYLMIQWTQERCSWDAGLLGCSASIYRAAGRLRATNLAHQPNCWKSIKEAHKLQQIKPCLSLFVGFMWIMCVCVCLRRIKPKKDYQLPASLLIVSADLLLISFLATWAQDYPQKTWKWLYPKHQVAKCVSKKFSRKAPHKKLHKIHQSSPDFSDEAAWISRSSRIFAVELLLEQLSRLST